MQSTEVKAAVLAIGTELTCGQITNRNAAWISERLTRLGVDVRLHECVPDDRDLILDALDHCARQASLLVITGGLGPTSDDFTREVLAQWAGLELRWHEPSWTKIQARLTGFGVAISESNRAQCFYPAGAEVIENSEGTANAFRFEARGCTVIALPGPPKEGQHVWDASVEATLQTLYPHLAPEKMWSWMCMGQSEAALAETTETEIRGSGLRTGYRASAPYVEVKVSLPRGQDETAALPYVSRLEHALAPFIVTRGKEDLAQRWLDAVSAKTGTLGITILDLATQGVLTARLMSVLQASDAIAVSERTEIMTRFSGQAESSGLPDEANEWIFALFGDGKAALLGPNGKQETQITSPTHHPAASERIRRYRTEKALLFWTNELLRLP